MKKDLRIRNLLKTLVVLSIAVLMMIEKPVRTFAAGPQTHNYYKGVSTQDAAMADSIAQNIALSIMNNPAYVTDLQKVKAAAYTVASYAACGTYGKDVNKYYRSPFGVFCSGIYTCAGTTRALGRVLDCMGYSYIHMNEDQYGHQWCVLTMDGQIGYADGMSVCQGL